MYKRQWTCYRDMIADHGAEEKEEERKKYSRYHREEVANGVSWCHQQHHRRLDRSR